VTLALAPKVGICVPQFSCELLTSLAPVQMVGAYVRPFSCEFSVPMASCSCESLVSLAPARWVGVDVQPFLCEFLCADFGSVFSSVLLFSPGQDPIPCQGEGDRKGSSLPPGLSRRVSQVSLTLSVPIVGQPRGLKTREDLSFRSLWEGGGTESS